MTVKSRLEKLEKSRKPVGRMYVIWDNEDHVIACPGGYMTKAEFEALTLNEQDVVIEVVYIGVDLETI